MNTADDTAGPRLLGGVRVLDFTRVVSGPFATLILADLGAEVIKVERPETGDDSRQFGPPFVAGQSTYFAGLNRGKKSLVIDLSTKAGQDLARRLADQADVLIENFRPGYMARVGLDYETAACSNRRLIYCSITGFGPEGPYRDRAAYDVTVSAIGGMLSITGFEGAAPVKTGVALLDVACGLYAFGGITSALYERERTGVGQLIEISMLEVQVATLINAASAYLMAGETMRPQGTAHSAIVPYQAFEASDGWMIIGALNTAMYERLCVALERPALATDARYATNEARVANRDALIALIEQVVREQPIDHWVRVLGDAGVAVAPINAIDRVFADPQVLHSGIVREVVDTRLGRYLAVATPLHFNRGLLAISGRVPALGEDAESILKALVERDS